MSERKTLKQSVPALVLFIYSLLSCLNSVVSTGDTGVTFTPGIAFVSVIGSMAAAIFYARRNLDMESLVFMRRIYGKVTIVITAISILLSLFVGNGIYEKLEILVASICAGVAVFVLIGVCSDSFATIVTMTTGMFAIVLLVCIFVVPGIIYVVANIISGIVTMVIAIVLCVAVCVWGFESLKKLIHR